MIAPLHIRTAKGSAYGVAAHAAYEHARTLRARAKTHKYAYKARRRHSGEHLIPLHFEKPAGHALRLRDAVGAEHGQKTIERSHHKRAYRKHQK